jgi:hypothetical protein
LLALDEPLPPALAPLSLARASLSHRFRPFSATGYPVNREFADAPIPMFGTVADPLGFMGDPLHSEGGPVDAVILDSRGAEGSLPLAGFSGAPVILRLDLDPATPGPTEVVIGMIRRKMRNLQEPDRAGGGLVYATPMTSATQWAEISDAFAETIRVRLPSEIPIMNFVDRYLGGRGEDVAFGGRDDELRKLSDWLDAPSGPRLMLVTGPAGRGKSALLVRWVREMQERSALSNQRLHVVFVPVTLRWELASRQAVVEAMGSRIAAAYGHDVSKVPAPAAAIEYLRDDPPPGERVVVVLDGLDEAKGWDVGHSLIPTDLAPNVRVLVSARHTADRPSWDAWRQALGWPRRVQGITLERLSLEGVGAAIRGGGRTLRLVADDPAAVQELARLSGGEPFVLALYLEELELNDVTHASTYLKTLAGRQPGLAEFMDGWFRDQRSLWGLSFEEMDRSVQTLFGLLAHALGPLPKRDLLMLARRLGPLETADFERAWTALKRLVVWAPQAHAFTLAHPLLSAYGIQRLQDTDGHPAIRDVFLKWGFETNRDLASRVLKPGDARPYIVRHFGRHLVGAQADLAELAVLTSSTWRDAWEAATTDFEGHLEDIDVVQQAAGRINDRAVARGELPPVLREQIRSAVLRADAAGRAAIILPPLAAQLVRWDLWPATRALGLVRHIASPENRGYALAVVIPHLKRDELNIAEQLLSELEGIDPLAYGPALAAFVGRLAELGEVDRAIATAVAQPPGFARGLAQVRLSSYRQNGLDPGFLEEIVSDVRAASGSLEQSDLVDLVTRAVPVERVQRTDAIEADADGAARAIIAAIEEPWYDGRPTRGRDPWAFLHPEWLASVAPWLRPQTLEHTVDAILTRISARKRFDSEGTLVAIAPFLSEADTVRALQTLDRIVPDPAGRIRVVARLLPRLPTEMANPLVVWVSEQLDTLFEGSFIRDDLVDVIPVIAALGLEAPLLRAIRRQSDDWDRSTWLRALVPHLDDSLVRDALVIAREGRHEVQQESVAVVLGRLAEFSIDSAAEALETAERLATDEDERRLASLLVRSIQEAPDLDSLLSLRDPHLRLGGIAASVELGATVSASELVRLVESFGVRETVPAKLGVDAFSILLDRLPDGELAAISATAHRLTEVTWHHQLAEIIVGYLTRLVRTFGSEAVLPRSASVWPEPWAAIAIAQGLDAVDSEGLVLRLRSTEDALWSSAVEAALLRHASATDRPFAYQLLMSGIEPFAFRLYPRHGHLLVNLLPEDLRRETIDRLYPTEYLRGESISVRFDTWASNLVHLIPVLEVDHLHAVLPVVSTVGSSGTRDELKAAIAARLAALGASNEAFDLLRDLSGAAQGTALAGMAQSIDDHSLARWYDSVHEMLTLPIWRATRAFAWAQAKGRILRLPPADRWALVSRWLDQSVDRSTLLVDTITYAPALKGLGAAAAIEIVG